MGSGDWFKTIIGRKKVKLDKSKQSKGSATSNESDGSKTKRQCHNNNANSQVTCKSNGTFPKLSEDVAATRIQTAFRAHKARKALLRMKGVLRFQKLTQAQSVKKQSISTLAHLQSWTRIQAQIRDRRLCMVIEGRLKQKKLENQMKLEAKLHDLEVEWNGGTDTMEEILARVHLREEAAGKRERALAYAFTHQWKANSNQSQGSNASELGKANWGWSWKERWIAARPWESRVQPQSISPKKGQSKITIKAGKSNNLITSQKSVPVKSAMLNQKAPGKARRMSYPGAEKTVEQEPQAKVQVAPVRKRESLS